MKFKVNASLDIKSSPKKRKRSLLPLTLFRSKRKGSLLNRSVKKNRNVKSGSTKRKILKIVGIIFGVISGIVLIVSIVAVVFTASYLGRLNASLPDPNSLVSRDIDLSSKIFDRKGKLLYTIYGDKNREFVALDKFSEHTKWAVLIAEDADFYNTKGIDLPGILSAVIDKIVYGSPLRGASTIDQQVVRNTILYDILGDKVFEKSYERKVKEVLISLKLNQAFTKEQILQIYLNEIPLGGQNYGFQAASKAYFSKTVSDLSLSESAFLAGIIRAPSQYSPLAGGDIKEAQKIRDIVLDQMLVYKDRVDITVKDKDGNKSVRRITEEDVKKAKETKLVLTPGKIDMKAPHFVFYVIQELERLYGAETVKTGGLRVVTTLDLGLQNIAQDEVQKNIANFKTWYGTHNASLVSINPKNGEILTMVGSVNYNKTNDKRVDGNVNVAVQPRQMGSTVKPYTYLEAFKRGYNPGTLAPDIPLNFGAYKPVNWNFKYDGLLSIGQALNRSRNIPALYTLEMIGGANVWLNAAEKVGNTTISKDRSRYGLSVALGAAELKLLEHTNAYAMFANRGIQFPATAILKVTDRDGKNIFTYKPGKGKRLYSEQEVYLLNWVLCQIEGSHDKLGAHLYKVANQRLCGKTGTSNGPKDLTAFLYYPRLVVGVWSGNNNGKITRGTLGQGWSTNVPIIIARNFMSRVQGSFGQEWYSQPSGISHTAVCRDTGLIATKENPCSKLATIYISGHAPRVDNSHIKMPICTKNNQLASNVDDARQLGLIEDKIFLKFNLDNKRQQASYNKYMQGKKIALYNSKSKAVECPLGLGVGNIPVVLISSPQKDVSYSRGDVIDMTAKVTALGNISSINAYFDSDLVNASTANDFSFAYTIPDNITAGSHTIKIVAQDGAGRSGESSVIIVVNESINVSVSAPVKGSSLDVFPVSLQAQLSGDVQNVSSVKFYVQNDAGTIIETLNATKSGTLWGVDWVTKPKLGIYTIYTDVTTSGGTTYNSSSITITVI